MKLATIKVNEWIKNNNLDCHILLQVHDELLLEVENSIKKIVSKNLIHIMENIYPLSIPLKVNLNSGSNWLEAHN